MGQELLSCLAHWAALRVQGGAARRQGQRAQWLLVLTRGPLQRTPLPHPQRSLALQPEATGAGPSHSWAPLRCSPLRLQAPPALCGLPRPPRQPSSAWPLLPHLDLPSLMCGPLCGEGNTLDQRVKLRADKGIALTTILLTPQAPSHPAPGTQNVSPWLASPALGPALRALQDAAQSARSEAYRATHSLPWHNTIAWG